MKITIDTKTDSSAEIKRAIEFLKKFIGESTSIEPDFPSNGDNVFGMFDADMSDNDNSDNQDETKNDDDFSLSSLQTY